MSSKILYKGNNSDRLLFKGDVVSMEQDGFSEPLLTLRMKEIIDEAEYAPSPKSTPTMVPEIKKVIFSGPATIILWEDGTKTVVKCGEDEMFDPEKGMAMAIAKKALGNKGKYYDTFKPWLDAYYEAEANAIVNPMFNFNISMNSEEFTKAIEKLAHLNFDGSMNNVDQTL